MTSIRYIAGLLAMIAALGIASLAAASSANVGHGFTVINNVSIKNLGYQGVIGTKHQGGPVVLADADCREKRNRGHK